MKVHQPRIPLALRSRARQAVPFLLSAFSTLQFSRQASARCFDLSRAFVIGVAFLLLSGAPGYADRTQKSAGHNVPDPFSAHINEAAKRFGIPASWIRAVIQVESGGDTRAVSLKGALGLMQIMPETWADLRFRYGLGADPFDPRDNILAGAAYLRELFDRYGSPGFVAAYNAGPARYEAFLRSATPLPAETSAYIALLTPLIDGNAMNPAKLLLAPVHQWAGAPLFIEPFVCRSIDAQTAPDLQIVSENGDNDPRDVPELAPHSSGLFINAADGTSSQ